MVFQTSFLGRTYEAIRSGINDLLTKPIDQWTVHDLGIFLLKFFIGLLIIGAGIAICYVIFAFAGRIIGTITTVLKKILRVIFFWVPKKK